MKVKEPCRACLEGLIEKTVSLSAGGARVMSSSLALLDRLYTPDATPPAIANMLLDHIRRKTGVYDPYATIKYLEYKEALSFMRNLRDKRPVSLSDHIQLSALGNSTDFFTGGSFHPGSFVFEGDMERIENILISGEDEILMLGDNMGDLVFDQPLASFLEERGKTVFYAVKGSPVQNDVSLEDIARHDLGSVYSYILSTEKAHVGLSGEDITGPIERLWTGGGPVIAKGMGNFETIGEFDDERQVIYIMKVKCPAVAEAVQSWIGTYIARVR